MCPYFNQSKQECRVVIQDSNARREEAWKRDYCMNNSGYKRCGNYEAAQRGDYKIRR